MKLLERLRALLGPRGTAPDTRHGTDRLANASEALEDLRGDNLEPQPPTGGPSSLDNVAAAAKDYGLSRFSGESDAMGGAAKSYRPAKSRKQRREGR